MKHFSLACLVAIVFLASPTLGNGSDCTRTCPRIVGRTIRHVPYDSCLQLCCGGELVDRDVYLACCGSEFSGMPYNYRTQICCEYRGAVVIHERTNATVECCGTELFDREMFPTQTHSCCYGSDQEEPQIFDHLTEMCCQGCVQFAGNTAYTQCCGKTSYDRRVASCPCQNDVVYIGVPMNGYEDCCYSDDRTIINAYDRRTQQCCAAVPYETASELCCDGSIGIIGNQTCCGNTQLTPINAETSGSGVRCCELSDGSYDVYNAATQACCGNIIQNLDPSIRQICCGGVLFNSELSGSMCCGSTPYFPLSTVCCGGVVSDGDRCCAGMPFSSEDQLVCCQGEIVEGTACCGGTGFDPALGLICCQGELRNATNFVIPSCCVLESFDSYTHTCCGSTVYDNPLVPDGEGGETVSRTTRCCGVNSDPDSLRPYDYFQQRCCDGIVNDLGVTPIELSVCCGDSAIDQSVELCCMGNVLANPYDMRGECCGDTVINSDTDICCGGMRGNSSDQFCCGNTIANLNTEICCDSNPVAFGGIPAANAECCGDFVFDDTTQFCCGGFPQDLDGLPSLDAGCCGLAVLDERSEICCGGVINQRSEDNLMCCGVGVFDPMTEKCCEGEARPLNGIPSDRAICCGDGCIDGGTYWCCNGQQYSRGSIEGEDVESLTCNDVLPM